MNITSKNGHLVVSGNIKNLQHSQEIQAELSRCMEGFSRIVIEFVDSFALTSVIIGYLLHIINKGKAEIEVWVHNDELHELLVELNLDEVFRLKKINNENI